jgi:hypothetical protein
LPAAVLILFLLAVMAGLLPLVVGTLFERDAGRPAVTVAGLERGPSESSD